MSNLSRRTVTLGKTQSDYIDDKIASGDFVSASEVVRAGLAALAERDGVVERWLANEVSAAFDHSVTNPHDVVSIDEAFAEIRSKTNTRAAA